MQFQESKEHNSKNLLAKGWFVRSTMAVALMSALVAGCQAPQRQAAAPEQTNVTTEDVAENTNRYLGQTVTIRSEPIDKIGPSTFTAQDQQFFGSEPILVVNASGQPFVLPEDGVDIQATGEVRNFVLADVNREYNLGLDANTYRQYESRPAIIAQSLAVAPEPGELTSNPQQYYGKPLAVTGEVNEVQGVDTFTLDENQLIGGQELLVLRPNAATANQAALQNGEQVAVTGTLRSFAVADLEREYDFDWDTGLRQQLEAEYSNRPVLVADGVYPSAIPDGAL